MIGPVLGRAFQEHGEIDGRNNHEELGGQSYPKCPPLRESSPTPFVLHPILRPRLYNGLRFSVVSAVGIMAAFADKQNPASARTGDPLNPIIHGLYAISREMPGFMRVSGTMARYPDPRFRGSRAG